MKSFLPKKGTEADLVDYHVRFVGGTTAVTKVYGKGLAVSYSTTGVVKLTWSENPGNLVGVTYGFQATTASGLKGWTMTCPATLTNTAGVYSMLLSLWNSSFAATDLAALQWLTVVLAFKESGV